MTRTTAQLDERKILSPFISAKASACRLIGSDNSWLVQSAWAGTAEWWNKSVGKVALAISWMAIREPYAPYHAGDRPSELIGDISRNIFDI